MTHSSQRGDMTDSASHERASAGLAQKAVRASITAGTSLPTPTERATFILAEYKQEGMILLLGPKRTATFLTWDCLEGVIGCLRGRGWVRIGANRDVNGDPGTFDAYLKRHINRQVADYVAVVLERARLVELNRERPASLRLMQ
jgi:hypothetical protein